MNPTKKNAPIQTRSIQEVGSFISKESFTSLRQGYSEKFPDLPSSIIVQKELLNKVMGMSEKVKGIRFAYGLDDPMNPKSVRVMLIPCTTHAEYDRASRPMVSSFGYPDHKGNTCSVKEVAELIHNFVQNMLDHEVGLTYKNITRGSFFGKKSLSELIREKQCEYVRLSFGFQDNTISPILEPLNESFVAFTGMFLDLANPCPPTCDTGTTEEVCLATLAVTRYSNQDELNLYREFRDNQLLNIEGGGVLYEMYYFISPLITSLISKRPDGEVRLKALYQNKILPFKNMIKSNQFTEAAGLLREALDQLASEYESKLITSD